MRNKKLMWIASICLMTYMIISVLNITNANIKAASTLGYQWKKNDTMDELLQIVSNKAGDDEGFLSWDFEDYGTYTLEYYLKDKVKTVVTFTHEVDKVIVNYNLFNTDTGQSILQQELDKSYAEMNYDLMIPQLETKDLTIDPAVGLTFTVTKGASSKYPGASFIINNMPVRFKWDLQTKKLLFLTKGVQKGYIVPFKLSNPDNITEEIQLLRSFDNFNIEPTHWVNKGTGNEDLKTIEIPANPNVIRPGSKPGLRITFNRPLVFNEGTQSYDIAGPEDLKNGDDLINAVIALRDIRNNGDNADIIIELGDADGNYISPPVLGTGDNKSAIYKYDSTTGTYTIEIVKDRTDLGEVDFLQWDNLGSSRVYSASITLEESPIYQFHEYEPMGEYAYTYLDYEVKRASMDDAYLDIVPYAGSNEDDLEYTVFYSKTYKSIFGEDDIWLKHYHKKDYADTNIYIPVPFKDGSTQEYYQVGVQFAGSPLRSQTIKYVPLNDKNVPPPVPRIKEVKNLAVVPPEDTASDIPTKVQFDLVWHAPDRDLLNNMLADAGSAIYYEMLFNDVPSDSTANAFTVLKVFKVYKDGADIKVEEVDTGMQIANPSKVGDYKEGYNVNENLFELKDIVLKDSTGWSNIPTRNLDTLAKTYNIGKGTTEYNYEFPGINFMRMRAVYVSAGGVGESDKSIADSLSLSMIKYEVPIAGGIDYSPLTALKETDPLGIKIEFKLIDIKNYENHMLYPIDKEVNGITYGVYISEDKSKILDLENVDPANPDNGFYQMSYAQDAPIILDSTDVAYLRNKDVLFYDNTTTKAQAGFEELNLLNLDPNTNYYIRIVTKLNVVNKVDPTTEIRRSEPSSMLSATSPVVPSKPDDNELVPLAPEKMDADYYDDSMISGEISWEFPTEIVLEEDKYGFELISIENRSLPDSLSSGKMLQDIFDSDLLLGDVIEGWRLYVKDENYVLKYYDKATKTWIDATQTFRVEGNKITIIDDNNLPNKVYYYYARTIKIISEVPKGASVWVADTLTTAAIKRPINLIVDHQSTYSYDPKREVIIRFDAPVPTDYYITGDYVMKVFVKGDGDTDYSNTKYTSTYITQVDGANEGYTRALYRISGLKPGTIYNIKVQIEDRTKEQETLPNGNKVYPRSSFSERVSTRTEFDQEDYDKENKYLEYIKYYEDKASELKKTSYWEVEMDDIKQIVKYREDYNIGELKYVTDGKYFLVDATKATGIYYLPAKMIETANENGITIFVKFSDGNIGIRPYTISKDKTAEIIDKIEEINKYNNKTSDYYIKLIINFGKYNDTVLGKVPATDLVNFDIQIVGSNMAEDDFEILILQKFDEVVANKKSYLMNQLDNELTSGIDEAKLLKIVTDTLKLVKDSHRANVKMLMSQYIQTNYSAVNNLGNSIHMAFNIGSITDTLQGYKKNGGTWTQVESDKYGNSYNIEAREQGAYIFIPRSSMYNHLDDIYNGMVTDVIAQYNLIDIFSSDELSNLESKVARYQIISSTARVIGAQKGYDNEQWLAKQNIKISSGDMYGQMTKEEALYLFMQAYSIKNDMNLNFIKITDYNIIEDISNIDKQYREVLLKGVNLGVIKLTNGRILPNESVDIELVLEMLTRINKKIDW